MSQQHLDAAMKQAMAQAKAGVPPQQVMSMLPPALLLHMAQLQQSMASGALPTIAAAALGGAGGHIGGNPVQQVQQVHGLHVCGSALVGR